MKVFTSNTQRKGEVGENIACDFLIGQGHRIVARNYTRRCGELDIVTEKGGVTHFIEVKTVTREMFGSGVNRETNVSAYVQTDGVSDEYRPEDNMHPGKLMRLRRVVEIYLMENELPGDGEWQFDLITVVIDKGQRPIKVTLIEDLVL